MNLKSGTLLAICQKSSFIISDITGGPDISVLLLAETVSLIRSFCLSVAARTNVCEGENNLADFRDSSTLATSLPLQV